MKAQRTFSPAVVMNMFHSGLGIARSLGERGVPVFGLSAVRGLYGNFTRYARVFSAPDSRTDPDELFAFLIEFAPTRGRRATIFPTRDADIVFLHRFREELRERYSLAIPSPSAVEGCLDKWQTYQAALRAGVPVPKSWKVCGESDLRRVLDEAAFPCILKPLAAYHWREAQKWQIVGERKAMVIQGPYQLLEVYTRAAKADRRALVQEMVPGDDTYLRIAAVYRDRNSNISAAFNTQKVLQLPVNIGTGCVVQSTSCPELFPATDRLLAGMEFAGIAEVEFKWHPAKREYQLIEVNARPWDQHRLGAAVGSDVIWAAYCDHAGIAGCMSKSNGRTFKWIAEDALLQNAPGLLWRREMTVRSLVRFLRGKRIYGIWSLKDPLPFVVYFARGFIPSLLKMILRRFRPPYRTATSAWQPKTNY